MFVIHRCDQCVAFHAL